MQFPWSDDFVALQTAQMARRKTKKVRDKILFCLRRCGESSVIWQAEL
jgi:hypothetical protein